ncbi:hypothetical protein GIB67_001508 [Kingdonia uniflora]|uniref:DUF4283 domain-containing protein n=1 Tax=Kingdonia uniflora TaxID=39325 RepID=A0A7J7L517_9MAGN|nr:hypothetical protein GIB67_001508 [Kingdonia uniflora]
MHVMAHASSHRSGRTMVESIEGMPLPCLKICNSEGGCTGSLCTIDSSILEMHWNCCCKCPTTESKTQEPLFQCLKECRGESTVLCKTPDRKVIAHVDCRCECLFNSICKTTNARSSDTCGTMKTTSYAEMIGAPSKGFADETKECENMLVGNFIGRRLPYMFNKTTLMKLWDLKGDLEMTTKGRFLFFFQFSCDEDRQRVLDMGHQHIASRIFFIRAWRPFIEFEPMEMKTFPIWVMLHDLLAQFWNADGISRIVSALGVPLFLDKASEDKRKGRSFVRICVEMSVDCAFPKEISIEMDESYTIEIPPCPCPARVYIEDMENLHDGGNMKWVPKKAEGDNDVENKGYKEILRKTVEKGKSTSEGPVDQDGFVTPKKTCKPRRPDTPYYQDVGESSKFDPLTSDKGDGVGTNEEAPGDPSDQVGKTKEVGEKTSNLSKRDLKRVRRKGFKEDQEAKKIVDALLPSKHKYNLGEEDCCTMKRDALACPSRTSPIEFS